MPVPSPTSHCSTSLWPQWTSFFLWTHQAYFCFRMLAVAVPSSSWLALSHPAGSSLNVFFLCFSGHPKWRLPILTCCHSILLHPYHNNYWICLMLCFIILLTILTFFSTVFPSLSAACGLLYMTNIWLRKMLKFPQAYASFSMILFLWCVQVLCLTWLGFLQRWLVLIVIVLKIILR